MRSTVGISLLTAQAVALGQGGGGCQLVIAGWELDRCEPRVIIQPDGRRSPGRIHHSDGSRVSSAPGKRSAAIKEIGEMALKQMIG